MSPAKPEPASADQSLSEVIRDLGEGEGDLTLREVVEALAERGFGAMLFLLGMLSVVVGAIPGSTTILGLPMVLIGVQLVVRRDELWLPKWALDRSIARSAFAETARKIDGPLKRIERFSKPRLRFMNTDPSEMAIGVAVILLALILMLPLIGFNLVPSLIVAAFGFGLTQRDGVILLIGWVGSAGFGVFTWLMWELVSRTLMAGWDWVTGLL